MPYASDNLIRMLRGGGSGSVMPCGHPHLDHGHEMRWTKGIEYITYEMTLGQKGLECVVSTFAFSTSTLFSLYVYIYQYKGDEWMSE